MTVLDEVARALRCPVCREPLAAEPARLRCSAGHAFDRARQGYVNLAVGARGPGTGDTAAMVAARDSFFGAGHFAPVSAALADAARAVLPADGSALVVDLAGGTAAHLAVVLDALPAATGLCLDLSAAALRRAARAHPRAAAVGADAWGRLPLADGTAGVVLSVFGPRGAPEIARVLAPGGVLVTASPSSDHLGEIAAPLGLLAVDPDKDRRQSDAFAGFGTDDERQVRYAVTLSRADALAAARMGPTAHHVGDAELARRAGGLPVALSVTVAVRITRRRPERPGAPQDSHRPFSAY